MDQNSLGDTLKGKSCDRCVGTNAREVLTVYGSRLYLLLPICCW